MLNHTDPKTTAIYTRLGDDPARQALAEHGQRLTAIAGEWFPAGPVPALLAQVNVLASSDALSDGQSREES
jgi:hypothetical protein